MLFNSLPFLFLFFLTYLVYWNISNQKKKNLLLFASCIFYGFFSFFYLLHFLSIILLNFLLSKKIWENIDNQKKSKLFLQIALFLNLFNLILFKYFYFFTDLLSFFFQNSIFKEIQNSVNIILPLAISFYTFQLIALQVDIYQKKETNQIHFKDYVLFILFFPQLIAGPIMRTKDFFPNLKLIQADKIKMNEGIFLILSGLFKKIIIADNIAILIEPLYTQPSDFHTISLLIGSFGFFAQIYCDFSGYTDIARGCAKLLGYDIPENFVAPLLSSSFREFWQRWHITLSTWLRDYLYFPLGGSKKGKFRTHFNLIITMSVGGIWHGANLNFLIWGFLMGFVMVIERPFHKKNSVEHQNIFVKILLTCLTYSLISLITILFRTAASGNESFSISVQYYLSIIRNINQGQNILQLDSLISWIFLSLCFNFLQLHKEKLKKLQKYNSYLIPTFSVFILLFLGAFADIGDEFIYFQF